MSRYLNPEEQVPDLINHLWIATCLSTGEALESSEHKVRRIFEVKQGLYILKIVGRLIGERTIFDRHAPFPAPLTIYLDAEHCVYTFGRFLVHSHLHEDKHVWHEHSCCTLI